MGRPTTGKLAAALAALALALALAAGGCAPDNTRTGYTKQDFSKRPAPPGYGPPGSAPAPHRSSGS